MRMLNNLLILALACGGVAIAAEPNAPVSDDTAEHCLSLQEIASIKVIDKDNLAIQMKNGDYYLNHLSSSCPSLRRHSAISYTTPLNRLCNLEIITVLEDFGGDLQTMGACGLGKFTPASRDEIRFMQESS